MRDTLGLMQIINESIKNLILPSPSFFAPYCVSCPQTFTDRWTLLSLWESCRGVGEGNLHHAQSCPLQVSGGPPAQD